MFVKVTEVSTVEKPRPMLVNSDSISMIKHVENEAHPKTKSTVQVGYKTLYCAETVEELQAALSGNVKTPAKQKPVAKPEAKVVADAK